MALTISSIKKNKKKNINYTISLLHGPWHASRIHWTKPHKLTVPLGLQEAQEEGNIYNKQHSYDQEQIIHQHRQKIAF